MKFGLMVEKETRNIGDDIQSYATKSFLPRIDYYIDRNHMDEFVPDTEEKVATIINGWFLQYTLNWPFSPYVKPLPISMHFTYKDWFWDTTDRAYHLQGYGLEYLKSIEPIGCRDSHTMKLLQSKGIKTEYTGCMTLTLQPFKNVEKRDYICAVDVSDAVIEQIKKTTDMEVKIMTHTVPEDYYNLSWEKRMENVELLLKTYQGAKAVIAYRLHCALPCLALGTPVILLNEDYRNDRFGDYTKYIESCNEEEFVSGEKVYDYRNIPTHSDEWKELAKDLTKRCENFISECEKSDEIYENDISIEHYKKYVIGKSNWIKSAAIESYNRFEEEKKRNEQISKTIDECQKDIEKKQHEIEYYKEEFNIAVQKIEKLKIEIEAIKNSKVWKITNKLKSGCKKMRSNKKII